MYTRKGSKSAGYTQVKVGFSIGALSRRFSFSLHQVLGEYVSAGLKLVWCPKTKRIVLGTDFSIDLSQNSSLRLAVV